MTANRSLPEKQENLKHSEFLLAVSRRKLDNLKRRKEGAALSKDARNLINAFIKGEREDLDKRREFNL